MFVTPGQTSFANDKNYITFLYSEHPDRVSTEAKTCGAVIILIHKTRGLVIISMTLPGNAWFSYALNKCYSNLENFGSFIVGSLEMGMCLSVDEPALVCGWVIFSKLWPHIPV